MQALLRCPHGQETGWENQQGLRVYRHIADGSICGLLNGLLVTPEELMLERCRSFFTAPQVYCSCRTGGIC